MSYTPVKIDDHLHSKMKEIAGIKRGALTEEYRIAIENHIKYKTQEKMKIDSGLEGFINNRIGKMDKHLASLMVRNCIDTSMTLMGLVNLLEKLLKVDKEILLIELKKEGTIYFHDVIKCDKASK